MKKYVAKIEVPDMFYEINDKMVEVRVTNRSHFPLIQVSDENYSIVVNLAEMRALIDVFTEIDSILPEPEEYK